MTKLSDIEHDLWFADTEVFAYDNIWVFQNCATGETREFVNNPESLKEFVAEHNPILCGYNFHGYDSHILKGGLAGYDNAVLKDINDTIIFGGDDKYNELWDYFRGVWVDMPYYADLFHDIVPRRSLKVIEGCLGLSVEESDVSFDIDRPLTEDEIDKTVQYCRHDVAATAELYEHRREYLQSKITLCDICGEDPLQFIKYSNARVLAEVFHATPYEYDRNERYEIPDNIDLSGIPDEVLDYVSKIDCSVAERETDLGKLEFLFHGVPSTFGIGGIHSADEVPYIEESTDDRVLLIQDITSYYPSIILLYGYVSRAIAPECMDLYQHFYDLRVEAKKKGDKEAANAAKLVLNTFSGAMGGKFNKLYDPMMPLAMRITGQLAIMDAVNCAMADAPSARFIQLNTDGWVLSVNRDELDAVLAGVATWEKRTGFSVDTQEVRKIIQRDVNNYILESADGKVKTKGSTVAQYGGGDFKSNSLVVCQNAVVDYLLHGVPIENTINACDDIAQFQLVAKTGSTFEYTEWDSDTSIAECERLHMCNRIFASRNPDHGMVYKVKEIELPDGSGERDIRRTKVANCPAHAIVVNSDIRKEEVKQYVKNMLDKKWYITYAVNKANAFVKNAIGYGGKIMAEDEKTVDVVEETVEEAKPAPKRKPRAKKTAEPEAPEKSLVERIVENDPENINQALFKLQILMSGNSGSVTFDGFINNINYAYADTQQYKTLLAKCANECGLIFRVTNVDYDFPQMDKTADNFFDVDNAIDTALNGVAVQRQVDRIRQIAAERDDMAIPELFHGKQIMCMAELTMAFTFWKDGATVEYKAVGMGVGMQGNSLSIAETNAFRNFITNNFLMDNKGREGDDVATNFVEELAEKSKKAYVSPEEKQAKKEAIVEEKKQEVVFATLQYAEALYPKLVKAAEKDSEFAEKIKTVLNTVYDNGKPVAREDDPERSVMKRAGAAKLMREAEAIID